MSKLSRTESDPHYQQINNAAGKRHHFRNRMAWAWIKENRPDIAQAISDKAFELFPSQRKMSPVDLTFFDERTVSPKRTRNHV